MHASWLKYKQLQSAQMLRGCYLTSYMSPETYMDPRAAHLRHLEAGRDSNVQRLNTVPPPTNRYLPHFPANVLNHDLLQIKEALAIILLLLRLLRCKTMFAIHYPS